MLRLLKKLACVAAVALWGQWSWGFALLGPFNEAYQVPDIGYNLPGDIGAPKNLGEEYRHNTPVMYYSFDANFLDYFGSNGVAAVDQAIAILNSLPNVSQMSPTLAEYPLQVLRENYLAEALSLVDLKTWALKAMVEQLGLAEPERYLWTLHDRYQPPGSPPCPANYEYLVIQRNFDPVISPLNQFQTSSYVNGTLYTYYIQEVCQTPNPLAVTIPVPVDPMDFSFTAVAGLPETVSTTSFLGQYYIGLTRDDVGGLRYLLRPQNVNFESTGPNTLLAVTNPVPQILYTSNLTLFAALALTNDPGTLQTLIPNLSVVSSSNYFVSGFVTNVTPYFTNYPWDPAGSGGHLVFATNLTSVIEIRYQNTYGNLFEVIDTTNGWVLVPLSTFPPATNTALVTIETDTVGSGGSPWSSPGTTNIFTNTTFISYTTNVVGGDYLVLPTNICSISILASALTNVVSATNLVSVAINGNVTTNIAGFTNIIVTTAITYTTNHAFVVLQANCVPSGASLFGGVDQIRFVRRDYDSLLGRFFSPTTNNYVMNSLTNSTLIPEHVQRTVPFPDFLFSAQDFAAGPAAIPGAGIFARGINFNAAFANPGLAGPGTIESSNGPSTIIFQKVGPIYLNFAPNAYFVSSAEAGQFPVRLLGSFDGTTNAPIVYPDGTSVVNLENQMLIGIAPGLLPVGQVAEPYQVQFTATGGQPPYLWSLAPGSAGLPPGFPLNLPPNGLLSGTPTLDGTFDFIIRLTDSGGRTVDRGYSMTINP